MNFASSARNCLESLTARDMDCQPTVCRYLARGEFSFAEADDGKTFGSAEARAVPPISADGTAGDVLGIFVLDDFVDVSVALQDGQDICVVENFQDFGTVGDGHGVVLASRGDDFRVGGERGDYGAVNHGDYGRGMGQFV